jgi:hypothetical protein
VTSQLIAGATVALEDSDKSGTDRIFMESVTESGGHFSFCPLPMGTVFDVVVDAVNSSGTAYNASPFPCEFCYERYFRLRFLTPPSAHKDHPHAA